VCSRDLKTRRRVLRAESRVVRGLGFLCAVTCFYVCIWGFCRVYAPCLPTKWRISSTRRLRGFWPLADASCMRLASLPRLFLKIHSLHSSIRFLLMAVRRLCLGACLMWLGGVDVVGDSPRPARRLRGCRLEKRTVGTSQPLHREGAGHSLASRLYLKLGWRLSDTYFLGSQTLSP
jgi:hypothetical protein